MNSQSSKLWVVRRKGLLSGSKAQILPGITRRSAGRLPLKDQTVSQVRLFGENVLTIDHADYKVSVRPQPQADASLLGRMEVWGLKNLRNL